MLRRSDGGRLRHGTIDARHYTHTQTLKRYQCASLLFMLFLTLGVWRCSSSAYAHIHSHALPLVLWYIHAQLEYCARGSLYDMLLKRRQYLHHLHHQSQYHHHLSPPQHAHTAMIEGTILKERDLVFILRCILSALSFLHSFSPPIVHRDVKAANVLVDQNGVLKLADFAISTSISSSASASASTSTSISTSTPVSIPVTVDTDTDADRDDRIHRHDRHHRHQKQHQDVEESSIDASNALRGSPYYLSPEGTQCAFCMQSTVYAFCLQIWTHHRSGAHVTLIWRARVGQINTYACSPHNASFTLPVS